MNKSILVGRLTKKPELQTTANGVSVCSFTAAVNRRFKNADGEYDADFINCVVWRNQAEFLCKYFDKGSQIGLVGSIQTRNYDDKDGKKVYITEVVADEIHFVGDKSKTEATPSAAPETTKGDDIFDNPVFANEGFMPIGNDDNPFGE